MEMLDIFKYIGTGTLILLLIIFELTNRQPTRRNRSGRGYEYFTVDGNHVLIHHVIGDLYKVYAYGACPVQTRHDRYGDFFEIHARSASEAELKVDQAYTD